MKIKSPAIILFILTPLIFGVFGPALGQSEATQDRTREKMRLEEDEETRALRYTEMAKKEEKRGKFSLAYGGWLTHYFDQYQNIDKNKGEDDWIETDYYLDSRLWMRLLYSREFMFYARVKNQYFWRPRVSTDYTGNGDDYQGPALDMGYVNIDLIGLRNKYLTSRDDYRAQTEYARTELARAIALKQTDVRDEVLDMTLAMLEELRYAADSQDRYKGPLLLSAGRQFFTLGRGIVYSNVHDGVQLISGVGKSMLLKTFISQSKPREDNLDYSVPNYDKENKRRFYGAELSYFKKDIAFYIYGLAQGDETDASQGPQDYNYDSQYLGAGVSGKVKDNLSYWFEAISEYGKSYTDAEKVELEKKPIDAYAFDAGAKYNFDFFTHPSLESELAYGSGDPDRSRVTNTSGGNTNGDDTNFMYYGVFNSGYALMPRLSNIWVVKLGGYIKPFEGFARIGDNIVVGSKYFYYRKDRRSGGTYDIYATEPDADIGQEIDFYIHWKMFRDLFVSARYGLFFPGKAYPIDRRDTSTSFFTKASLTF